jgi:tetratricopeptide (TPR) repeat protein
MSEMIEKLSEILQKQLTQLSLEVVGIVPLSTHSDRMVRIRTLEEIVQDFSQSEDSSTHGFILQVKKSTPTSTSHQPQIAQNPSDSDKDPIYTTDGKLNFHYLIKNAEVLFSARDYKLARNIYQAIVNAGEMSPNVFFQMGRCYEAEGNLEDARARYEEAIAFSPNYEYHQRLASLLIRESLHEQAAEVIERTLHLRDLTLSQRFDMYKSCGNCWTRANRLDAAEINFKKALELMPHADEIRSNLGALFLQSQRIQEARRHFQDALASNPRNHQALAGLGSCALQEGNNRGAHDYFAQSLQVELNNPHALFYLVKCAYELKNYGTAASILKDYVQNAPMNPSLLYSLAGLQFHIGRIDEAQETTKKTLELQPTHAGAKELMGVIEKYCTPPV